MSYQQAGVFKKEALREKGSRESGYGCLVHNMTPFSRLTSRNFLIATHDALATAFALLAAFYLRFEGGHGFLVRLPLLLQVLPWFVAFSVVVCYFFNLTTTKWRFLLAAGRPEHPAGCLGADGRSGGDRLRLDFRRAGYL